MHTKDKLAEALLEADLPNLAANARQGLYHDFLSPLGDPASALARHLAAAGTPAALRLRKRHLNGEFDATKDEADAWAESADGQETFQKLMPEANPKRRP